MDLAILTEEKAARCGVEKE